MTTGALYVPVIENAYQEPVCDKCSAVFFFQETISDLRTAEASRD